MATIISEKLEEETSDLSLAALVAITHISDQQIIESKFVTHNPKSGLNPLVDAGAYLFSVMGKLKELKSYRQLHKLHKELIEEINHFQDSAKAQGYSSEYILVSRYALCATLDDIITNTSWGNEHWASYTLLATFNQESINQERFFIILERLIKDPTLYIDVMEFMYICLSLGFKGHYRETETNHLQLEQIINALYKRIRAHRGDFSKVLSPFAIKANAHHKPATKNIPAWLIVLLIASVSLMLFAGMRYLLNVTSNQAYQDLTRMGKTISYETHDQAVEP